MACPKRNCETNICGQKRRLAELLLGLIRTEQKRDAQASLLYISESRASDLLLDHSLNSIRSQAGSADIDFLGLSVDDHSDALQVRHPPSFGNIVSMTDVAPGDGPFSAYFTSSGHKCLLFLLNNPF